MAFVPRLNKNNLFDNTLNYYIPLGSVGTGNPFENYDPVDDEYGNCTWYAWGRFWECGDPPTHPHLSTGNADMWYPHQDNYVRGMTPRLGAILCFSGGNTSVGFSGLGHVAIVEQINSDGTIVVSESGWSAYDWRLNTRDPNESYPYSNSWEQYNFQGFIYNPNVNEIIASPYVVSAICGNWWGESNVNPAVWENLSVRNWTDMLCGFGLGQWTNTDSGDGMRLLNLHDWVTSNGYQDGDGDGQLNYFLYEKWWGGNPQGQAQSSRLGLNNLDEFLQSNSTNLDDLVYDFLEMWEGIAPNDYDRRKNFARTCYQYIADHQGDSPSQYQWIATNNYLSESETLNNVMVIWFWFSSGQPVPPIPPIPILKNNKLLLYCNKRKYMRRKGLIWRL